MTDQYEFCEKLHNNKPPKLSTRGKWLLGLFGVSFSGVFAISMPFIIPALRKFCLPFVPATSKQVENVMELLKGSRGSVVDLGSGDGRIVIEAAKQGNSAVGIELNPWLVWYARVKAVREGVNNNTTFHRQDLFKTDFRKYDNIVIFGVDSLMEPLEQILTKNMSPNSHVIACRFPFPNWTPIKIAGQGIDMVWLYKPVRFQK